MAKYKLELKPVKEHGLDALPEDKKGVLGLSVQLIVAMLQNHPKINEIQAYDDFSIYIDAADDVSQDIEKLHQAAVLTRLD